MDEILSIDDLSVTYRRRAANIASVRDVSLRIAAAECVAVVGESGSGKTQVFMAAMGLLPGNAQSTGNVQFEGAPLGVNDPVGLNRVRGSKLTMIFQDPLTSLTPHLKIGTQMAEVLVCHAGMRWREARQFAQEMLNRVHIDYPGRRMHQYPYELSGGMRQRVMIAMSLLCKPSLLIADEPTTALDVTVQAQIMELLREMRHEYGMALVLVSHDLGVVAGLADRVLVMYAGRIIESTTSAAIFRRARHPYSAELLKCTLSVSGAPLLRLPTLVGQPPRPGESSTGCAFAPRCARAAPLCRVERPLLMAGPEASVACHFPLDA